MTQVLLAECVLSSVFRSQFVLIGVCIVCSVSWIKLSWTSLQYSHDRTENENKWNSLQYSHDRIENENKEHGPVSMRTYLNLSITYRQEKRNLSATKAPQKHVAFVKTHKCGSSTVTSILQRYGYGNNLTFILPSDTSNIISQIESLVPERNFVPCPSGSHFDVICNHVVYDRFIFKNVLPPDTVYIGIEREPFDQFVSSFLYYRLMWKVPYLKAIPGDNPIAAYLQRPLTYEPYHPGVSFTNNRMAYDFGFPVQYHRREDVDIKLYLEHIDADFKIVLITEYFDESLVLMRRILNWSLKDILYITKNTVNYNKTIALATLDSSDRMRYRKWAEYDYVLYNHFLARLKDKIKNEDSSFATEVSEFRRVRSNVLQFCTKTTLLPNSFLTVEAGTTHGGFKVNIKDCMLLQLDDIQFTDILRHRQYPNMQFTKPKSQTVGQPIIISGGKIRNLNFRNRPGMSNRRQINKFQQLDRRKIPHRRRIRRRPN